MFCIVVFVCGCINYLVTEVSNKCTNWSPALPLYPLTGFHTKNVSLNKLSHARRLSSQDVILCREDV